MNYQWYPGHMTKAVRMMQEDIKLIDLIIEIVDARIPLSSRNPDIDELGKSKFRLVLLNKADLANPIVTSKWEKYFTDKGCFVQQLNSKSGSGIKTIQPLVMKACQEKILRDKKRGILNRPIRAMVVGIPNVGKSTFINSLAKKACTKTGNKPGVTKGKQWIRLNPSLELLDTPGILWPKFEDQEIGMKLAFIGSINDEIIVLQDMALDLLRVLSKINPNQLQERYQVILPSGDSNNKDFAEVLAQIGRTRMCFKKGEEIDYEKSAGILIDDFRSGRLGRITLEEPDKDEE